MKRKYTTRKRVVVTEEVFLKIKKAANDFGLDDCYLVSNILHRGIDECYRKKSAPVYLPEQEIDKKKPPKPEKKPEPELDMTKLDDPRVFQKIRSTMTDEEFIIAAVRRAIEKSPLGYISQQQAMRLYGMRKVSHSVLTTIAGHPDFELGSNLNQFNVNERVFYLKGTNPPLEV